MSDKLECKPNAIGRFVSGSLTELNKTDHNNKPLAEDKWHYVHAIAYQKSDPEIQRVLGEIDAFLQSRWANDQQKIAALNAWFGRNPQMPAMKGLSMKIKDGDAPNREGQVNQNTVGCYVFWFKSNYPTKCCNKALEEIDASSVKRGYYVRQTFNVDDNGLAWSADGKGAGIYLNPGFIQLMYEGDEITGGGSATDAFGDMAPPPSDMPVGARPLGSAMGFPNGSAQSGNTGMPQGGMLGQMPQGGMMGNQQPSAPVQPPMGAAHMPTGQNNYGQMPSAPQQTASPSNPQMPNPHMGILGGQMPGQ
jgi:hypothetical protein